MKNLFLINEEEKNRILNLHENATKRQYLTEQTDEATKKVISEQIPENIERAWKFIKKGLTGPLGFGTDENALIQGFQLLKNKKDFDDLENFLKSGGSGIKYKTVADIVNGELEEDDLTTAQNIVNELKRIGITAKFEKNSDDMTFIEGSFTISVSETPAQEALDALITKLAYAVAPNEVVVGTLNGQKTPYVPFTKSNFFFTEVGNERKFYEFTKDSKTLLKQGTWSIGDDGKMTYKTTEDSSKDKDKPNTSTRKVAAIRPSEADLDNYLQKI